MIELEGQPHNSLVHRDVPSHVWALTKAGAIAMDRRRAKLPHSGHRYHSRLSHLLFILPRAFLSLSLQSLRNLDGPSPPDLSRLLPQFFSSLKGPLSTPSKHSLNFPPQLHLLTLPHHHLTCLSGFSSVVFFLLPLETASKEPRASVQLCVQCLANSEDDNTGSACHLT